MTRDEHKKAINECQAALNEAMENAAFDGYKVEIETLVRTFMQGGQYDHIMASITEYV